MLHCCCCCCCCLLVLSFIFSLFFFFLCLPPHHTHLISHSSLTYVHAHLFIYFYIPLHESKCPDFNCRSSRKKKWNCIDFIFFHYLIQKSEHWTVISLDSPSPLRPLLTWGYVHISYREKLIDNVSVRMSFRC